VAHPAYILKFIIMKPEAILQSDMLDILFENRNKAYGAYSLRKNYNKRLLQAMGGMGLFVVLFIAVQGMRPKGQSSLVFSQPDSIDLVTVIVPPEEKKPDEQLKTQPKVRPEVNDARLKIIPDDQLPETKVPTVDELDKGNLGTKTVSTPPTGDPGPRDQGPSDGETQPAPIVPEPIETGPLNIAEVMPSFNGDIVKYMLRNLPQPGDIEEGQRIVVRVKFVVSKEGEVTNVEIIQSGRPDLDKEVLRVVKRMPHWKPGMQGGRPVPVYFHLPVTFVNNTE
jgi:periplasmic protein TonB